MRKQIANTFLQYRRIVVFTFYVAVISLSFLCAFLLRFDFAVPALHQVTFYTRLPILLVIKLAVFWYFSLYSGMWRYVNPRDIWNIVKANALAALVFAAVEGTFFRFQGFPRSVLILDWLLCIFFMGGARIAVRLFREHFSVLSVRGRSSKKVLIVGAGNAGLILLDEYGRNPGMGTVVGFIDDDRYKQHMNIHGIKILGSRKDIPRVVKELGVDEIILAIPSATGEMVRGVLAHCQETQARIRVVPGMSKLISGEMEVRARDVKPDDLLGRETVTIDQEEIRQYVQGKVVLVTGAGGSIGSEICRQVASFAPKKIILFDHHENLVYFLSVEFKTKYPDLKVRTVIGDICDVGLLKSVFSQRRPQVVFHAAAHKHVPLMEDSPTAAVKNNIFGTRNMIYASHHYHAERFVLISTDKAVNPINVMGMSKRVAEMILQAKAAKSGTKFMAVRFGNVLGSAGSVVPLFKKQIEDGGPLTVTHPEVKRYFMSIKEAVMLVLQAGALGKGGELFILDMGEQIKVVELAKNLIAFSGLTLGKDIEITFTGLRHGEKLEEELFLDKEKDQVTEHNRIFVNTNAAAVGIKELNRGLRKLKRVAQLMDETSLLKLLKQTVDHGTLPGK
ncbi:MAG: polysaccharide biosynthesis protein [Candidatus Omnitrophica bacterium]|nr:polysaccharide biosynthesis protein [Candidatus Omnitrophota bacterium]